MRKKVICFHNPEEINGYLSNWYLSDFCVNKIRYSSMEQYMMHQKALLFEDPEIAGQIMDTADVGKIKALGRSVRNYEDILWNGMRQIIVCQGLLEKFKQNAALKEKLLATQDHILAECAVQDKIWGIGLSMKDERRFEPNEWQGQNLLGFSLMKVRAVLKQDAVLREQAVEACEADDEDTRPQSCHKTKERTAAEYRSLVNRLNRIEGQIRGIRGMLERDAYCPDILIQVAAVNAALNAFSKELLGNHIRTCVVRDIRDGKEETVDELLTTLRKLMK